MPKEPGGDGSTLDVSGAMPLARPVASSDLVGSSLLHFKVLARLGAGGMGVVYKAFDDKLRRTVALKVLGPRYVVDDRNKELIFREARSAAGLNHPNIASIYELHEAPEGAFYVMELVEGETLRARIDRGKLPVEDVQRWALQIARALARAHEAGIIHRDLKSDNVMITRSGEVKLLDFGLAKVVELAEPIAEGVADQPAAYAATAVARGTIGGHGRVLGTPAYMAPEQARGEEVDARADVFSFGVVLYEMLTGRAPFATRTGIPSGDSTSGDWTIRAKVAELAPRTARAYDALVQRCLEFDREARPANGTALLAALEAYARSPRPWKRNVALAVLPVLALGAYVLIRPTDAASVSACDDASTFAAHWDAPTRARVEASRHGKYAAEDLASLEAFAFRWQVLHHAACQQDADAVTHTVGSRRLACLDRALSALDRVTKSGPWSVFNSDARVALPALDRCAGATPELEPAIRLVSDIPTESHGFALSPDGRRYAVYAAGRVVISLLDGEAQPPITVPAREFAGWSGNTIRVFDDKHEWLVDPDTGSITSGMELPAGTIYLSTDGAHVLTQVNGDLRIVATRDGTTSADFGPVQWSPNRSSISWSATQMCVEGSDGAFHVADFTTGHTVAIADRLDLSATGMRQTDWLDDHHLVFSGRALADQGEAMWSVAVHDGQIESPPQLLLDAQAGTSYQIAAIANHRVLVQRLLIHTELVRVHDGKARGIENASGVASVASVDVSGDRIAALRETSEGVVSAVDGSFLQLGRGRDISLDGEDVLVREDKAPDTLDAIDTLGHRRVFLKDPRLLKGYVRCAAEAPRCFYFSQDLVAEVIDGALGPALELGEQKNVWVSLVSRDATHVAFYRAGSVEVVDLATHHIEHREVVLPPECSASTNIVWAPGDAFDVSAYCRDGFSRVFRLRHGAAAEELFASSAYISGFAVTGSGDLVANLRHFGMSIVLVEGL